MYQGATPRKEVMKRMLDNRLEASDKLKSARERVRRSRAKYRDEMRGGTIEDAQSYRECRAELRKEGIPYQRGMWYKGECYEKPFGLDEELDYLKAGLDECREYLAMRKDDPVYLDSKQRQHYIPSMKRCYSEPIREQKKLKQDKIIVPIRLRDNSILSIPFDTPPSNLFNKLINHYRIDTTYRATPSELKRQWRSELKRCRAFKDYEDIQDCVMGAVGEMEMYLFD